MPYILKGTKDAVRYWNTLGRPCLLEQMANAVKSQKINFMSPGVDQISLSIQYGETEAQALAALLGVTVANVTTNANQIQI